MTLVTQGSSLLTTSGRARGGSRNLRPGAAGAWWPIRSSKPAGRGNPTLGRFDSFAASLLENGRSCAPAHRSPLDRNRKACPEYLTAAFTGLRLGEQPALHWRDVDSAGEAIGCGGATTPTGRSARRRAAGPRADRWRSSAGGPRAGGRRRATDANEDLRVRADGPRQVRWMTSRFGDFKPDWSISPAAAPRRRSSPVELTRSHGDRLRDASGVAAPCAPSAQVAPRGTDKDVRRRIGCVTSLPLDGRQ